MIHFLADYSCFYYYFFYYYVFFCCCCFCPISCCSCCGFCCCIRTALKLRAFMVLSEVPSAVESASESLRIWGSSTRFPHKSGAL
jgi:hypothetical protein